MKKLARQILLLAAILFVICGVWRLTLNNTYTAWIRIPVSFFETSGRPEEGDIVEPQYEPEDEGRIAFGETRYHRRTETAGGQTYIDDYLEVQIRPEVKGKANYTIHVPDVEDNAYGSFRVGPLVTVYDTSTGGFTGDTIVLAGVAVFLLGTAVLMLRTFRQMKGPEMYSYSAVYLSGFSIFAGLAGLMMAQNLILHMIDPLRYMMLTVYETICSAGWTFMLYTSPLILAFAIWMAVSNVELLRHEKPRFQNALGILAAVLLIAGEAVGGLLVLRNFSGSIMEYRIFSTVNNVYCTAFSYFECMLAGSVIASLRVIRYRPEMNKDYILILGCGFRKDGTLPPLLRGRCDRAIRFWKEQKEKTGKEAVLIPSGGQGANEPMPEAEAMRRYLVSVGIPEEAILKEDKSANTYQNMAFSKKLIEQEKKNAKVIYSTTNYHIFRSGVWASLAGLPAEGIGSRTKWWFWPNAFLRECVGLFANRIRKCILLLVILIVFYAVLTMVLIV